MEPPSLPPPLCPGTHSPLDEEGHCRVPGDLPELWVCARNCAAQLFNQERQVPLRTEEQTLLEGGVLAIRVPLPTRLPPPQLVLEHLQMGPSATAAGKVTGSGDGDVAFCGSPRAAGSRRRSLKGQRIVILSLIIRYHGLSLLLGNSLPN